MITVWKATINPADAIVIEVPEGAELLCAREQYDKICVWFRCESSHATELRRLYVVGTGGPAPATSRYLGTASLHGGRLMLHVFEE